MVDKKNEDKSIRVSIGFKQNALPNYVWIDGNQILIGAGKIYKLKSGLVDEIHCPYFLQRIPARFRQAFFEEVWRCLKLGGKAIFITPYWNTMRAFADMTHEWPPITEMSFCFLNKKWMTDQKIHYSINCNFEFTTGYALEQDVQLKAEEVRNHWVKHYSNTVTDLHVTLIKAAM
jgi:hypothetical protein